MVELVAELCQALEDRRPCVWCSLIETRGSTPQKAGAAMLVFPDGSQRGTLGGGCVEAEVKERSLRLLNSGDTPAPAVLTFHLDNDYGWDDGLICGGRMRILADPAPDADTAAAYYRQLLTQLDSGRGFTEIVVADDKDDAAAHRYLIDAQGRQTAAIASQELPDETVAVLKPVKTRPRPYTANGAAFLPQWPRVTVLIVGGGHVGLAVAKLAAEVDFDVNVLDDREAYVSEDRFPMAQQRYVGDIGQSLESIVANGLDESTFCLIVTRGHNHDEEALYHLAECGAGYVGMIGSKRKIKLIFDDLCQRGISDAALERVNAPLGLDIGSKTVPEIAVSIVAQLISCRNLSQEN